MSMLSTPFLISSLELSIFESQLSIFGTQMLCLVGALQAEVSPLIAHLGLKKSVFEAGPPVFEGTEVTLIQSGIGKIRSAVAATRLLGGFSSHRRVFAINIGCCGSKHFQIGELVIVNKIRDHHSGLSYFPDLLIKHGLKEAALETYDYPVSGTSCPTRDNDFPLVDMEGAGFFEAANAFLPPSRILLLKVVSDALCPEQVSAEAVTQVMRDRAGDIEKVLQSCQGYLEDRRQFSYEPALEDSITELTAKLSLTVAQERLLRDALRAYLLRSNGIRPDLSSALGETPATKQEQRRRFAGILDRLGVAP
jgi:adenosylhomocysteine nucleosidase